MMVSKEITKELIEYCKENEWWEVETKYLIEDLEKILKDLEVLEILKKSIKETGISKGDGTIILKWELFDIKEQKSFNLFNITIKNEEDFNKVKEWLNGKD